jgi:hypothetical protein
MNVVKIEQIQNERDRQVKDFLMDHMPRKVDELLFDTNPVHKSKEFTFYQYELIKCFEKITKQITLTGFTLNRNQMELILIKCQHIETIGLWYCNIDSKNITFDAELQTGKQKDFITSMDTRKKMVSEPPTAIPYKVRKLSFYRTGNHDGSTWGEDISGLEFMIEAIRKCALKNSIKELEVDDCDVTRKQVQGLLDKNGLSTIKLWIWRIRGK